MARYVLKFGGTSVGSAERIKNVAKIVGKLWHEGHELAVVVSAMSGRTNELVGLTADIAALHDAREYDVVVASGEQITIGLLAMALQEEGIPARSWLGWQLPIRTDDAHSTARIEEIESEELIKRFKERNREVAVIAGFQGLGPDNRISTLGRGGSDTSAVAVAAALDADRCDIFTDVDGVYTTDPRIVEKARKIDRITYEEMLELASLGAKVLHARSVEIAMNHQVPLQVLSTFTPDIPGTMVTTEEQIVEKQVVSGIAYSRGEAKFTLMQVKDKPGIAATIFSPLADANINVDMIVQNITEDGKVTDITFTVPTTQYELAKKVLEDNKDAMGYQKLLESRNVCKISIVGVGMRSHVGVAQQMFHALADKGVNIQVISTSEIKVSVLIDEDYTELAIRALHTVFGLDAVEEDSVQ